MLVINATSLTILSICFKIGAQAYWDWVLIPHLKRQSSLSVCLLTYVVWAAGTLYKWLVLQQYVSLQFCAILVHFQIQLTSVSICDGKHKIVPCLSLYHTEVPRLTAVDLFSHPQISASAVFYTQQQRGPWNAATGTGTQHSAVPCHWHSGVLAGLIPPPSNDQQLIICWCNVRTVGWMWQHYPPHNLWWPLWCARLCVA